MLKQVTFSIAFHAFLGFLWLLYNNHILGIANSVKHVFFVGGLIIILGNFLFWVFFRNISPIKEYKFTHPVSLSGIVSILIVVAIHLFVVDLV
ncbi:hypothetical protein [Bacillus pinisoli]|uniref:hypothetical protein n=1 Tax=Bacillus pinisoli TaxID=2901866 RepID=UPI001FF3739F|nr:hypothetical protein [Bacillus pinisoli]